jgi:hypothetical protein
MMILWILGTLLAACLAVPLYELIWGGAPAWLWIYFALMDVQRQAFAVWLR